MPWPQVIWLSGHCLKRPKWDLWRQCLANCLKIRDGLAAIWDGLTTMKLPKTLNGGALSSPKSMTLTISRLESPKSTRDGDSLLIIAESAVQLEVPIPTPSPPTPYPCHRRLHRTMSSLPTPYPCPPTYRPSHHPPPATTMLSSHACLCAMGWNMSFLVSMCRVYITSLIDQSGRYDY